MRYFLLHKPRGCITSTVDDTGRGRPTVYDVAKAAGVPSFGPVGRLDFDTSGALLFTDDFKLKKAISSPTYKGKAAVGTVPSMEKVYHLLVAGTIKPDDAGMRQLEEPLHFSRKKDGPGGCWTKPAEARVLLTKTFTTGQPVPWRFKPGTTATITWVEVAVDVFYRASLHEHNCSGQYQSHLAKLVLREGKNRQIRRLCRRSAFELTRLHRVSVGPIVLGDLEEGCCRELSRREVEALYLRCLPQDPLCPTLAAVQGIFTSRLAQAVQRAATAANLAGRHPGGGDTSVGEVPHGEQGGEAIERRNTEEAKERGATGGTADGNANHADVTLNTSNESERGPCTVDALTGAEDVASIVGRMVDFARRCLHETPPGPDGESAGPGLCAGEKESLAQARAVPPDENHMVCGYRSSQIERLGLTYGVM